MQRSVHRLAFSVLAWLVAAGGCTDSSPDPKTLREAAEAKQRLFGAALSSSNLNLDPVYAQVAGREFDYATPESEMNWDPTETSPGTFNFAAADQVVAFAAANGMQVKGHTLVWHHSLPAWVSNLTTAGDLRAAMTNHIQNVVGHYAGSVVAWDVVDEALTDTTPTTYRDTIFSSLLGETYIDEAFQLAHAADPNALLFYNESDIDWSSDKLDATVALMQRLLAAGVPVSGVGFETHVPGQGAPTGGDLAAALKRITDLGLLVNLSELDVRVGQVSGDLSYKFEVQRSRYHELVAACVQNPQCMSVTTWGVTDAHTWLDDQTQWSWAGDGPHYPLLFNADGTKKPAYAGTLLALLGQ